MSITTTALVVPELNGKFELREIYLNDIQDDEVLVEIKASGVCHTDLSCAIGLLPCGPGAVLGHEGAGVVVKTGSAVTHVVPGDKVLLSFTHCQSCAWCQAGHPAYCQSFHKRNFSGTRPDGTPAMLSSKNGDPLWSTFFGQSSFAKHTLAHRSSVVKVPAETDLALFAPLGCGMQTGAGAVLNSLDVKPGSTVAVFGVGSVGMAAVMAAAKIRKAKTVIAIDLQPSRLELAKKLGATHGILGSDKDVVDQIKKICPPFGVDYAVECTGVTAVVRIMVDALGTRGRGATVGAPGGGQCANLDIMDHLHGGKEYVGSCEGDSNPPEFLPFLMEAQAKGEFPLEEFISYYDAKDYQKAMDDSKSGKAIKAVLKW